MLRAPHVLELSRGPLFELLHAAAHRFSAIHKIILSSECFKRFRKNSPCDNFKRFMSADSFLSKDLYQYLLDVSSREPAILRRLREETAALPNATMQIPPDHGQFLALL